MLASNSIYVAYRWKIIWVGYIEFRLAAQQKTVENQKTPFAYASVVNSLNVINFNNLIRGGSRIFLKRGAPPRNDVTDR